MGFINKIQNTLFPNKNQKLVKAINGHQHNLIMLRAEIGEKISESDKYSEDDLYAVLSALKSKEIEIVKAEQEQKKELVSNLKETNKLKYNDKLKESLGRKRHTLPQVDSESLTDFMLHFKDKADVKIVTKKISELKPSQDELDEDKVYDILAKKFDGSDSTTKYIISSDNYILDGHHRWGADLELDSDDTKLVDCYQIDVPIKQLIKRANMMNLTKKRDINDVEKSFMILNFENDEEFDSQDEMMKSLSPQIIEHILYEHRPVGIPNDEFVKAIETISEAYKHNEKLGELLKSEVESQKRAQGLVPVRRNVRRDDGTTFSQIFWVLPNQIEGRSNPATETNSEAPQRQVRLSTKAKKMFEHQKSVEHLVKVGDDVVVRFIGAITGNKYNLSKGFKVARIKAKSIVVETTDIMWDTGTGSERHPMTFRKGQRFEIPRTTSPLWSEFQNFELHLSEEEIKRREEALKAAFSPEKIAALRAKGFDVFPELVGKTTEYCQAYLEKYMEKWKNFNPDTLFTGLKSIIHGVFGDGIREKYIVTTDSTIGKLKFSVTVDKGTKRLMFMERNEASGGQYGMPGKKGISHSFFALDPYYQGGGFCKKIFHELYKQYKDSNVDFLAVHANISVGGYTWASMGFHVNKRTAMEMVGWFRPGKKTVINKGETYIIPGKGDCEDVKIEGDKLFIKRKGESDFTDVTDEKCITPMKKIEYSKIEAELNDKIKLRDLENWDKKIDPNGAQAMTLSVEELNEEISKLQDKLERIPKVQRYKTEEVDGRKIIVDDGRLETYEITEADKAEAQRIFNKWNNENPGSDRFPAKLLANISNKKAGKAAMLGTDWNGTCDLRKENERILFEQAIGWENSVISTSEPKPVTTRRRRQTT